MLLAFACLWCLVLGFGELVPEPADASRRRSAQVLLDSGVHTTATEVQRYVTMGRDWYVAEVRATYPTTDGPVTAELQHIDPRDPVVREAGWTTRGPYEYWEQAPADSWYAAPLELVHDPSDPGVVMAVRDARAALAAGRSHRWAALAYATPALTVLIVPRWRRWLTKPLRRRDQRTTA